MNKRVFFWCSGIENILLGNNRVDGLQVQMTFWAKTFLENGWDVFSFGENSKVIEGINIVSSPKHPLLLKAHLSILAFRNDVKSVVKKYAPNVIIVRGATAELYFVSRFCKNAKVVYFSASDSDFIPNKEILTNKIYSKLYRKAIPNIPFIVTQNQYQGDQLNSQYSKKSLQIPNIWKAHQKNSIEKIYAAVWVANLKPLKRAEWFIRLAQKMPEGKFVIIGRADVQSYYDEMQQLCSEIPNIEMMGAKPFDFVSDIIAKSKLLVCTSEFEGFPNTFLQAWSCRVPVISTVNPSDVLTQNNIGIFVNSEIDLFERTHQLLSNETKYSCMQEAIEQYFLQHHDANNAFEKLVDYIVE